MTNVRLKNIEVIVILFIKNLASRIKALYFRHNKCKFIRYNLLTYIYFMQRVFYLLFLILFAHSSFGQNNTIAIGEKLTFTASYNMSG